MANDFTNGSFELMRTKSPEELAAVVETLTTAGVPHRVSSTQASFDITTVGRGDSLADMMVMVTAEDLKSARAALEGSFEASPLPGDHFLHSSSDEEIMEILAEPQEWDPFVVVHARRLAAERDLNPVLPEEPSAEHLAALEAGKPAENWQVILGWVTVVLGGFLGIWIGFSLAYGKDNRPEGSFHTYDAESRSIGSWMMWSGLASLFFWRFAIMATR